MAYYVRECAGEPNGVHWDRCRYRHREDESRWYGPFTTQDEARDHAQRTGSEQPAEDCNCLSTRDDYWNDDW